MKIFEKVEYAKKAIEFITTHDDAPIEEVQAALDEISVYMADQMPIAVARREAAVAEQ